jgi:hypothetical protein
MFSLQIFVCGESGYHPYNKCRKSDEHPYEDLAKSDYKPNMKSKFFNHPSIFWLHPENQV